MPVCHSIFHSVVANGSDGSNEVGMLTCTYVLELLDAVVISHTYSVPIIAPTGLPLRTNES